MSRPLWLPVLAVLAAIGGCARSTSVTEVEPTGAWKRTVTFAIVDPMASSEGEGATVTSTGPKIEDVFELPTGKEWKVTRKTEKGETTVTMVRELAVDEVLKDIRVREAKKLILENEVRVRKLDGDRLEYVETFRWKGKRPVELDTAAPELVASLKSALPTLAEADLRPIAKTMQREIWKLLFGPGDPALAQFLTQPELIERRMRQRLGKSLLETLKTVLGDRISENERLGAVRKMMTQEAVRGVFDPDKEKEKEAGGDGNKSLVSMLCVVRLPGVIVETNGEVDPIANEVFWALYPEAAAPEDVVLRAVCQVGKD